MLLYNTLTRKKEEFVPLEEGKVRMYVCGPTVYDYIHIGNARPYVVFDTIRRYLEYIGYEVNYVQNFTDVDDKIIKRANEQNVSADVISKKFIAETLKDALGLNVKKPTSSPLVTEEIDSIIEMVETLVCNGYAYENGGTVYFDTRKYEGYGKLSKKNIDDLEAGARVEVDLGKKNPTDFVLWKPFKPGEPKWDSPWGAGRPGWHIECSAMAKKYLGDTIDIHAGGEDLVFPHHENEVAQSEAANGKPFARYWLHNGFINIDNQKMSKSKGNFFTLREIAERFPFETIRFFIISAHYRSPINFSDELLQAAENGLNRIKNSIFNLRFIISKSETAEMNEKEKESLRSSDRYTIEFNESMEDDFNTADGVTAIFELVKFANINVTENSSQQFAEGILNKILSLCDILGLSVSANEEVANKDELEKQVDELINERQLARKNKDFKTADQIRQQLTDMGIVLEDTPSGVRWSHKGR